MISFNKAYCELLLSAFGSNQTVTMKTPCCGCLFKMFKRRIRHMAPCLAQKLSHAISTDVEHRAFGLCSQYFVEFLS